MVRVTGAGTSTHVWVAREPNNRVGVLGAYWRQLLSKKVRTFWPELVRNKGA